MSTATRLSSVMATNETVTITEAESSLRSMALASLAWMNSGTSVEDNTPPMTSS